MDALVGLDGLDRGQRLHHGNACEDGNAGQQQQIF